MNKKFVLFVVILVIILGVGGAAYAAYNAQTRSNNTASSSDTKTDTTDVAGGEVVTVTGIIACLSPKNETSNTANMSCAIGLLGDDGKNYALGADDPSIIDIPTGYQVKLTGTFTEQSSQYDAVGVIKVKTLEKQ